MIPALNGKKRVAFWRFYLRLGAWNNPKMNMNWLEVHTAEVAAEQQFLGHIWRTFAWRHFMVMASAFSISDIMTATRLLWGVCSRRVAATSWCIDEQNICETSAGIFRICINREPHSNTWWDFIIIFEDWYDTSGGFSSSFEFISYPADLCGRSRLAHEKKTTQKGVGMSRISSEPVRTFFCKAPHSENCSASQW